MEEPPDLGFAMYHTYLHFQPYDNMLRTDLVLLVIDLVEPCYVELRNLFPRLVFLFNQPPTYLAFFCDITNPRA